MSVHITNSHCDAITAKLDGKLREIATRLFARREMFVNRLYLRTDYKKRSPSPSPMRRYVGEYRTYGGAIGFTIGAGDPHPRAPARVAARGAISSRGLVTQ